MSVSYTSNVPKIILDTETQISLALRFMLEGIDKTAGPRTPKDKGNLRNDVLKSVIGRKATIAWTKEYAIYQEEKQFANYTTPGTGPHFAKNAVQAVTDDAEQYFKKARLV